MNWELFLTTFAAIFIAEMGDKTQIATFSVSASSSSRWVVFLAASLALVSTSAIAVLVGNAVSRAIPPIWMRRAAGVIFIGMGVLYLVQRGEI